LNKLATPRLGDTECVFLAGLHRAERAIAERLLPLNRSELPWPWIDPGKAIPWIEQRIGLTLAVSQKAAVATALGSKVLVITGGPGVGKTTIVTHSLSEGCEAVALRAHRPRRQAHE
jgi:exodeoxyribonuclease V alpha subunit